MTKQIYRGYDIEQQDGKWIVTKDGKVLASAAARKPAMDFVDIERRKASQSPANG